MMDGSECVYDIPSISVHSVLQLLLWKQLTCELISRDLKGF
jgi:hypothetical protein